MNRAQKQKRNLQRKSKMFNEAVWKREKREKNK